MKHLMAVTGLLMVLFLFVHMAGNLQIFAGPDKINAYGVKLREFGPLLWLARFGLIALFLIHVSAGLRLAALNREARPVGYHYFRPKRSPFYARMMPASGLILLAFVVYHLLHFTFGAIQGGNYGVDPQGRHDIYTMMVLGFHNPIVATSYIFAMALLCLHLMHGIPSFFQSLGFNHPRYQKAVERSGPLLAGILFLGNSSMPLAVLLGALHLPAWVTP
jgi:succinate dehydrogenase / fumarate reductase cytochrome b subunit